MDLPVISHVQWNEKKSAPSCSLTSANVAVELRLLTVNRCSERGSRLLPSSNQATGKRHRPVSRPDQESPAKTSPPFQNVPFSLNPSTSPSTPSLARFPLYAP